MDWKTAFLIPALATSAIAQTNELDPWMSATHDTNLVKKLCAYQWGGTYSYWDLDGVKINGRIRFTIEPIAQENQNGGFNPNEILAMIRAGYTGFPKARLAKVNAMVKPRGFKHWLPPDEISPIGELYVTPPTGALDWEHDGQYYWTRHKIFSSRDFYDETVFAASDIMPVVKGHRWPKGRIKVIKGEVRFLLCYWEDYEDTVIFSRELLDYPRLQCKLVPKRSRPK